MEKEEAEPVKRSKEENCIENLATANCSVDMLLLGVCEAYYIAFYSTLKYNVLYSQIEI